MRVKLYDMSIRENVIFKNIHDAALYIYLSEAAKTSLRNIKVSIYRNLKGETKVSCGRFDFQYIRSDIDA